MCSFKNAMNPCSVLKLSNLSGGMTPPRGKEYSFSPSRILMTGIYFLVMSTTALIVSPLSITVRQMVCPSSVINTSELSSAVMVGVQLIAAPGANVTSSMLMI